MNDAARIVKVGKRVGVGVKASTHLFPKRVGSAESHHTLVSYTTLSYSWRRDSGLEFEWDPAKADANFRKHGITFDQAIGVFYDPMVVMIEDERFAYSELREVAFGLVDAAVLAVVYIERRET